MAVGEAQAKSNAAIDAITDFLQKNGVEEKDIRTTSYSLTPNYRYNQQTGENTTDGYNVYQEIYSKTKNETLTQRRVSDIIAEFDMLGIINARVISKGRQGRTREIKLMLASNIKPKAREILQKSLDL